ncbi:MAG TPA: ribonuclease H-like domain-containing protein [Drouetiella sp.]
MSTEAVVKRKPELFERDLPEERLNHYLSKSVIAVDTETRGLIVPRDRLCLVQLCDDEGLVTFVRFQHLSDLPRQNSNLKKLMEAPNVTKLFHFARFDVAVMKHYLNATVNPIWCTKIASKLVRTYTDRHSLKDLTRELLHLEMDKSDQSSDWAKADLTDSQLEYAANDVRNLHALQTKLRYLLDREDRLHLAERLFLALPIVCDMDLGGWHNIFEH